MKQVKLLFLLSVSLISTVALPMNLGGRFASRVMPRLQAAATKVRATAQNVKAKAFPTFCKAVNIGIGTAPFVGLGVATTGIVVLDKENTKNILQATVLPNGFENADENIAALVRGKLNISVLVAKGSEAEEGALRETKNLTYIEALKRFSILSHADKAMNNMIIISSELHRALLSPEMFVNRAEHQRYCAFAQSVIQKVGGSCLEGHELLITGSFAEIALINYMLGKRVGPLAKRLLKMNPVATTKKGMLGRAIFGGVTKGAATYAGCEAFANYLGSRSDECIDDEHRKNFVQWLYFSKLNLWGRAPDARALLFKHHPAYSIKRLSGSFDRGAEYVVDAIKEDKIAAHQAIKKILAEETEEKKIDCLVNHFEYSPDVSTWTCSLSEAVEKADDQIDAELRFMANNDDQWIRERKQIVRQMEYATSFSAAVDQYVEKAKQLAENSQR